MAMMSVDLPAPVRPTTPIFSPGLLKHTKKNKKKTQMSGSPTPSTATASQSRIFIWLFILSVFVIYLFRVANKARSKSRLGRASDYICGGSMDGFIKLSVRALPEGEIDALENGGCTRIVGHHNVLEFDHTSI